VGALYSPLLSLASEQFVRNVDIQLSINESSALPLTAVDTANCAYIHCCTCFDIFNTSPSNQNTFVLKKMHKHLAVSTVES